ncbi:MAG: GTP-binding protein [Betaproteobacteria bacterium]|nr:GTP-binding protein [Betaproteobacteria bacterium]MDE2310419.1 GTP-binding protein [Betaproteobacteria bacterium]
MKTTVVCGLLGSGKTTFIRNSVTGKPEKTVVLVNDFAKAGIDGEIFSAGGIESVELPSGCICCTLKLDLVTTIQNIVAQFSPEHLLIEPSGVASPSGVLEAIESAGTGSASVIGIVDSTEFAELYELEMYGSFFEDQIVNSDVILVNKTDLADQSAIDAAERLISTVNPRAILFRTVNAKIDMPLPDAPLQRMIVAGNSHLHFETYSFPLADKMEFALMQQIFDDLSRGEFGRVARAKALVSTTNGPYRFDSAFGKTDAIRFDKDVTAGRLVVIGENLDDAGIGRAVRLT